MMRRLGLSPVVFAMACGTPDAAGTPGFPVDLDSGTAFPDAAPPDAQAEGGTGPAASRCTLTSQQIECTHASLTLLARTVVYQTPLGPTPAAGWPTVVYFQGSFMPGESVFSATASDAFGAYELTRTVKTLLDAGYAVVSPNAALNGKTFWQTNIPPYAQLWSGCSDDLLVQALFESLEKGDFGALNTKRLYAMGISSGGFMTSRMAVSYQGKFRALADHSGSYATCGGTVCSVPTPLPSDHPPTLLLRGDKDTIVAMAVVTPYLDALVTEGHEAKLVTHPTAGHEWLPNAAEIVTSWFDSHP